VIEFVPQVGDSIGSGELLFLLHAGADTINERKLQASVVLGSERTMDQDPLQIRDPITIVITESAFCAKIHGRSEPSVLKTS
jgi:hypothetical protein